MRYYDKFCKSWIDNQNLSSLIIIFWWSIVHSISASNRCLTRSCIQGYFINNKMSKEFDWNFCFLLNENDEQSDRIHWSFQFKYSSYDDPKRIEIIPHDCLRHLVIRVQYREISRRPYHFIDQYFRNHNFDDRKISSDTLCYRTRTTVRTLV